MNLLDWLRWRIVRQLKVTLESDRERKQINTPLVQVKENQITLMDDVRDDWCLHRKKREWTNGPVFSWLTEWQIILKSVYDKRREKRAVKFDTKRGFEWKIHLFATKPGNSCFYSLISLLSFDSLLLFFKRVVHVFGFDGREQLFWQENCS